MQYKIGEVANILGITAEAIRYYESQGVITPIKYKKSNYRYYSKWDIELLIRARCLRSYGYSIAETVEILNSIVRIGNSLPGTAFDMETICEKFKTLSNNEEEEKIIEDICGWLLSTH